MHPSIAEYEIASRQHSLRQAFAPSTPTRTRRAARRLRVLRLHRTPRVAAAH